MIRVSCVKSTVKAAIDVIESVPVPSQQTGDAFNRSTWLKDVFVALDAAGCIQLPMAIGDSFNCGHLFC
jgi:hypothetical protein